MDLLSALEDRFAGEQLSEDTPNTPHIDCRALQISTRSASPAQETRGAKRRQRT